MKIRALDSFLNLYPPTTRRALRWALVWSVLIALLDFVSLLLLLPVFGALATGGTANSAVKGGPISNVFGGIGPGGLVVIAMGAMITRSVAGFAIRFWWSRKVADAEVSLSSRLLGAYAYAPYEFHLKRNSADLLSRAVAHVNACTGSGLNGVVLLVTDGTTVLALGAALFVASPLAGGLVLGYIAVIGSAFVLLSRRFTSRQAVRYAHEVGHVYRRAATILRGIRELTVAGGRQTVLTSIDRSRVRMVQAQRNMTILTEVPRLTLETALYAAILTALIIVLNSPNPSENLPVVALYVVAGLRVLPAITRCLANLTQVRTGMEIGRQVGAELADVEISTGNLLPSAANLPRRGTLALDHVSFAYADGEKVVHELSLDVEYGTFLAIVGPSGSGKSTLLGIVLGLLRPSVGSVTYAGSPVGLADPEWLRHVGYVPQEAFVLDDDVLTNVALGDSCPDETRVWTALGRAALAESVRRMPDGLSTQLGEEGSRLSVGQRQRLGIARALYRDPAVLILDEPTAALDKASEAQVMQTINGLKASLTIILVAHRLETIANADFVVRLDDGFMQSAPVGSAALSPRSVRR